MQQNNPEAQTQQTVLREYGVPFRKLCCLEAGQFAQIPLKYAALQRLFKCRISKVLAGTLCDRGLPGGHFKMRLARKDHL